MFFRTAQAEACHRHATCHMHSQSALCPTCHTNLTQVANTSPLVRTQFLTPHPPPRGQRGGNSSIAASAICPRAEKSLQYFRGQTVTATFDSMLVTFLVSRKLWWSRALCLTRRQCNCHMLSFPKILLL